MTQWHKKKNNSGPVVSPDISANALLSAEGWAALSPLPCCKVAGPPSPKKPGIYYFLRSKKKWSLILSKQNQLGINHCRSKWGFDTSLSRAYQFKSSLEEICQVIVLFPNGGRDHRIKKVYENDDDGAVFSLHIVCNWRAARVAEICISFLCGDIFCHRLWGIILGGSSSSATRVPSPLVLCSHTALNLHIHLHRQKSQK